MLDGRVKWTNNITINGDGSINVDAAIDMDTTLPVIPKIGMSVQIPNEFNRVTWFGKGPRKIISIVLPALMWDFIL